MDRRDFLKRFSLISALSFGAAAGCSKAVYGPPPYTGPVVTTIYYLLPGGLKRLLYGAEDVSVGAQFLIQFSDSMQKISQEAVWLKNAESRAMPLGFQWNPDFTLLKVTPQRRLTANAAYTLLVTANALAADGTPIKLRKNARATFKTAALSIERG